MNAQEMMPLIYICFSLLAPLIPSLVIYKMLPVSNAEVSGPFHGLQIKLGGAFAGYFLLVFLSILFLRSSPAPPTYEVWEIQGKFRLDSSGEIDPEMHPISIIPPFADITRKGHFALLVAVPRKPNGELKFPALQFEYGEDYDKVAVPLSELSRSSKANVLIDGAHTIVLESNNAARRIELGGEVVLAKKAPTKESYLQNKTDAVEPVQIKLGGAEGQP